MNARESHNFVVLAGWVSGLMVIGYLGWLILTTAEVVWKSGSSRETARSIVALVLPFLLGGIVLAMTGDSYEKVRAELIAVPAIASFTIGVSLAMLAAIVTYAAQVRQTGVVYALLALTTIGALLGYLAVQGVGQRLFPLMFGAVLAGGGVLLVAGPPEPPR